MEKPVTVSPILGGPSEESTLAAVGYTVFDDAFLVISPTLGEKEDNGSNSLTLSIPTTGWNWGQLHADNAVDIANICGTPIYAAAEGLITEAKEGWNDGYGNYLVVRHPDGIETRYAHNQRNAVAVGQYVLQGDLVSFIGNTGNTHGPTGCHLHFEVHGTKNPFVKR